MKVVATLGLLVFFFEALAGARDRPIQITQAIQINPYIPDTSLFAEMGVVPRSRNCGGAGKKVSIRHEKCLTDEYPCKLPADGTGRAELVFIPSRSTTGLGVNIKIIVDGETKTFETLLPKATVVAGKEYTVTFAGGATSELLGKHLTTQLEIFRIKDKKVEVCTEQDHDVVS